MHRESARATPTHRLWRRILTHGFPWPASPSDLCVYRIPFLSDRLRRRVGKASCPIQWLTVLSNCASIGTTSPRATRAEASYAALNVLRSSRCQLGMATGSQVANSRGWGEFWRNPVCFFSLRRRVVSRAVGVHALRKQTPWSLGRFFSIVSPIKMLV